MLIRSHSICPEGIERFPDNLITITSNTNSSGVHNNDASILVIQKKLVISPKIIKPIANIGNLHWVEINMNTIPTTANSSVRRETTPPRKRTSLT